ncbi:MAG: N-acetyl sugar amidotransferase [Candidatus Omnitrophota bacterium]
MKYCKACLMPDTRPDIEFNKEGICAACVFAKQSNTVIDWDQRKKELVAIAQWAKENNHGGWDCAIGISGGKDSTFQALYARDELGLNCLLVNCYPDGITEAGKHNLENLVNHGFDMVSWRANPKVWRALVKRSFYEYGNPVKPTEYPLFAVTYQTALAYKIPMVIQGENPGLTLGSTKGYGKGGDAFSIAGGNTLKGCNASDWVGDGIELKDLLLYQFPDREEWEKSGIKAVYLQYYVKEWSSDHNSEFSVARGLHGREDYPWRRMSKYSRYASVDSDFQLFNPMVKYYKFGQSNWSEYYSMKIRTGEITREEAIKRVQEWDGYCDEKYIKECCDYMGITVDEFWREMEENWINKKLFKKDKDGKWHPLFKVGIDFDEKAGTMVRSNS